MSYRTPDARPAEFRTLSVPGRTGAAFEFRRKLAAEEEAAAFRMNCRQTKNKEDRLLWM